MKFVKKSSKKRNRKLGGIPRRFYKNGKRWYGRNPYLRRIDLVCRIV